jgi:dipeptidyl aminopeptidase/acylaminoacyl peptidase
MEAPVVITNEGQQMVGQLHRPGAGAGPHPAVLFLHGYTGNKQEPHRLFVQTARRLAANGVVALRFDFRGSGDSEGEFVETTLSGQCSDARAALAWLRERPEVDASRVGLVGMSLGGLIAAYLLGEDPALRAAVLWNPVGDGAATVQRKASAPGTRPHPSGEGIDLQGWEVSPVFVEELVASRPFETLALTKAKVLLIHGEEDVSVPVEDSRAYERALADAGGEVKLHLVPGAGHTFDRVEWVNEVVQSTTDWFTRSL